MAGCGCLWLDMGEVVHFTSTLFPLMTYMPFFSSFRAWDACTFWRTSCPLRVYTSTWESPVGGNARDAAAGGRIHVEGHRLLSAFVASETGR